MKKLNKNRSFVDNSVEAYACVCGCGCSCDCFCFLTIGSANNKSNALSKASSKAASAVYGMSV
jgi:putative bacteriocin precursor